MRWARPAQALLLRLDPDGREPREEEVQRRRGFTVGDERQGVSPARGELTGVTAAVWRTIIDALSAPVTGPDGEPDPRSAAQRRHDALHEAGLRLLRSGTLPDAGGTPVTVLIRTTEADFEKPERGRGHRTRPDPVHGPGVAAAGRGRARRGRLRPHRCGEGLRPPTAARVALAAPRPRLPGRRLLLPRLHPPGVVVRGPPRVGVDPRRPDVPGQSCACSVRFTIDISPGWAGS